MGRVDWRRLSKITMPGGILASFLVPFMVSTLLLSLGQTSLREAQQMLQDLDEERRKAATTTTASSTFTPSYLDGRLAAVEVAVNSGLLSMLNASPPPSCSVLEQDLRAALGPGGQANPSLASTQCVRWNGSIYYVVGYALSGAATYSRSWIGVFAGTPLGGTYRLLGSAENTLPNKTLSVKLLPRPVNGKLSFLAYGINWGDAHNRLAVIAYSLGEGKLEPVWSQEDLSQGQVKVQGDKIELTFLNSPFGPGYQSVHEISETYDVTDSGIKLEKRSEGPRP